MHELEGLPKRTMKNLQISIWTAGDAAHQSCQVLGTEHGCSRLLPILGIYWNESPGLRSRKVDILVWPQHVHCRVSTTAHWLEVLTAAAHARLHNLVAGTI